MGYNLLVNGVYWGYNSFTNHLLTSWDIQVGNTSSTGPFSHLAMLVDPGVYQDSNQTSFRMK